MNTYNITVKLCGEIVRREAVTATSALTAIGFVESTYNSKPVSLSDKGEAVQHHQWTGYEFEARNIRMEMS